MTPEVPEIPVYVEIKMQGGREYVQGSRDSKQNNIISKHNHDWGRTAQIVLEPMNFPANSNQSDMLIAVICAEQ